MRNGASNTYNKMREFKNLVDRVYLGPKNDDDVENCDLI